MPMEKFHFLFPEIGMTEYRSVILLEPSHGLPADDYGFVEAYCTEAGCDCRNVMLNVIGSDPPRHLATINFCLDPDGFDVIGEEQSFLDPWNIQTDHSTELLKLFRTVLAQDDVYVERLERHLAMVKSLAAENPRAGDAVVMSASIPGGRAGPAPARLKDLPSRNDPCHCGSGRKFKKCHWPEEMRRRAEEAKAEMARRRADEAGVAAPPVEPWPPGRPSDSTSPFESFLRQLRPFNDPALRRRVDEAKALLASRLRARPDPDASDALEEAFEAACRERWMVMAGDAELDNARLRVEDVDVEAYTHESGADAYEERRRAHATDLETLQLAGEAGVPHLGALVMSDSWASPLAIGTLVAMPEGPLRDRAVVEALFSPDEWSHDEAVREVWTWPEGRVLDVLEGVARRAAEDRVELQAKCWVEPFDRHDPATPAACHLTSGFAQAVGVLYALGHHATLSGVFEMFLDPVFDGEEGVSRFLDMPAVQDALKRLRHARPVEPLSQRHSEAVETHA